METQTDKATELTRARTADKMRGTDYYECHIYRNSMGFGAGRGETPEEAIKAANEIVHAVNQSQHVEALTEAAEANFAWHVAEELSLGSFQARMELCNYAQWLTRRALGELKDYEGVPRLLLNPADMNVEIARCDIDNCKALVREALDAAHALKGNQQSQVSPKER